MKTVYTTLLLIAALIIFICSSVINKRDKAPLTRAIRRIMVAAPLTMTAYAGAIIAQNKMLAETVYALYYSISDILLICMLNYALKYTRAYKEWKTAEIIMYVIVGIDSLLMFLNVFIDKIFIFRCTQMHDSSGLLFYGIEERGSLYNFHRIIIYSLVILTVIPLIHKVIRAPAMYRKKYWLTLVCLMFIVLTNIIYLLCGMEIDLSVLAYGLMACAIYYFNVIYVPQGLMNGLLSSSIKNMDDSVICFDIDGNCIYSNSMAHTFFRTEDSSAFTEYYKHFTEKNPIDKTETMSWKETHTVNSFPKYYDIQFQRLSDEAGSCVGCFFKMHDETEEVKKLEAERFRATHDRLTGIYNCEHFYDMVSETVKNAENNTYCMICSDIKNFKLVNDIFGIAVGDEVLINIAENLRKLSGPGAVYGRLSSDRFAVCMPRERYSDKFFAEKIKLISEIKNPTSYRVYIHVGVYDIVDKNVDPSVMCDRAYMAIKTIKASFTDTIAHYDDTIRENTISEQKITEEFRKALKEKQFCFYLQPQISADEKMIGGEALVRWMHPEKGLIPPGNFIDILERTGLIYRLDMYIWELACRKLSEWKKKGIKNHISVNISQKDFYFMDIYETFTKLVEKYEIDPHKLRLEITESAIMSDFKKQFALIQRLRNYGFPVEMDDFGSGYSSLNMLKDMIVDTLKIDMGFLRHTENSDRSKTILKMIVALSKQLGMEVITEGVETTEQVDFLREIGCDMFQGYYFAKPMPVSEFEEKYFTDKN